VNIRHDPEVLGTADAPQLGEPAGREANPAGEAMSVQIVVERDAHNPVTVTVGKKERPGLSPALTATLKLGEEAPPPPARQLERGLLARLFDDTRVKAGAHDATSCEGSRVGPVAVRTTSRSRYSTSTTVFSMSQT
jgi:hypothetical protein